MRLNKDNICLYCMQDTGGRIPCPSCRCDNPFNYDNPDPDRGGALKPGSILNETSSPVLIGRCLGTGGFGITYLALDALGKIVAVKEFMPRSVAGRASDNLKITAYKDQDDIYKYGLDKFVNEAKMLAHGRFPEHPNIVTIVTLFEENNTAYFTMVYRRGMTLEKYVQDKGSKGITQKELLDIMREVLNGLKAVHHEYIFHRDIKPSNIYIPSKDDHDTKPFLLDFGSARQAMRGSDLSKMSVFLTPGYAPVEQYKKKEKQGAYTDIYACAATMYACMRGRFNKHGIIVPPPESMAICSGQEKVEPLHQVSKQPVSREFSQAIHLGLQCKPHKRPQSVDEFEKSLFPLSSSRFPSGQYELLGIAGEYDGVSFPLNDGPIMLGRNPKKCNLVIPDQKLSRVSGEHCQVYTENGRVYLKDVSRHGTTLNESELRHGIKEIKPDDTLNLQGKAVFKIIQNKPEPLTPDPASPQSSTPASFWQRFVAWLIDSLLVGFMINLISIALLFLGTRYAEATLLTEVPVVQFILAWIYWAYAESSIKQATLGKRAMGIIITNMQGGRISFWRASGRFFCKILSAMILMIGFLMPIFTEKKQALHDMIAECLVVSKV